MSPQAIVSPEELENFARSLREFNAQLQERTSRLQEQFHRLDETWRDQEHARFAGEFEQTMRALQRFMQASDRQIPFLVRKAQRARDYLSQG